LSIVLNKLNFGFTEPLFEDINCRFDRGWSSIVGPNGSGKTSLINLIIGRLKPDSGTVSLNGDYIYCEQVVNMIPTDFRELLDDHASSAYRIKNLFNLKEEWIERWDKLSAGEQKRVQIAAAIYRSPEILILDEPTNHLDLESKEQLLSALLVYKGIGIIISHERSFLDKLPYQTLFLEPPFWDLRAQAYSEAIIARDSEQAFKKTQRETLYKDLKKIKKRASHYRNLANAADKRKSKKGISNGDHDAKSKIDAARISGKDAVHGKLLNQLQGRIKQDQKKLEDCQFKNRPSFDFSLKYEPSRRKNLFRLEAGTILMGEKRLSFNNISLKAEDKAAISGVNGCGKSTLLKQIHEVCRCERTLYIPQEIYMENRILFLNKLLQLDSKDKGHIFTILASLGSNPERVLYSENPSPGEIRKLLIADAIRNELELLILDEPTNHMDLPSVEALEKALSEYRAGLVLVSHDKYFLENTTNMKWEISETSENEYCLNQI